MPTSVLNSQASVYGSSFPWKGKNMKQKHGYSERVDIAKYSHGAPEIPGLSYFPEFISEDTAIDLLEAIGNNTWSNELRRRVQHYGYQYDYKARSILPESYLGPLPIWLEEFIAEHLVNSVLSARPDQVIVNEYLPGQGISAHIDCVPCFDGTIASLSLASAAIMVFTGPSGEREELYLQPGSLLVLEGDARFKWRHAIPARKTDMVDDKRMSRTRRVSLTFRKVLTE